MKKLEDLQVGDEVIITYSTHKSVGIVIRTTKLNVEVKAGDSIMMYSKKDGSRSNRVFVLYSRLEKDSIKKID